MHVIKYKRIFQSLFYFLKFHERETICQKETNNLEWKKCREFLKANVGAPSENLYRCMSEYRPFGPKDDEYKEYQKLLFIRENIEELNEEVVDEYSVTVGKLFRWLQMALELRIDDVKSRRKQKAQLREHRQEAIERETERKEKRAIAMQEAKETFDSHVAADRADR